MGTPALWIIFNAGVLLLLVLDLGVFNRRAHEVSIRQAALWSVFWSAFRLHSTSGFFTLTAAKKQLQFFTGYIIEQSMSVDNIFIFHPGLPCLRRGAALSASRFIWGNYRRTGASLRTMIRFRRRADSEI